LFTPQRLFGEAWSPPNTLSYEPFLERARLQREQDHDASARLALGGYVVARLVDKLLALKTDAESLEGFRWQLEAVRRHVGELPGDSPETAHLAGVVEAVPEKGAPSPALWMSLTAYAYFLEHEGRLDEALELVRLAAHSQGTSASPKEFAAYALFAGRLNRLLARWEAATSCYSAAEEAGEKMGDAVVRLRGRLGQGAVDRGRGNLPKARATAANVAEEAGVLGLQEAQAMAYADLGVVYNLQGLKVEALEAHYKAFKLTRDSHQQMRTLVDVAIAFHEIGAIDAARVAFQVAANSESGILVRANSLLELMDLESASGNRVAFERCRVAVEAHLSRLSPSMSVDYFYKLGVGLHRFEQSVRAREALTAGLALAETHGLNTSYFKIERALGELTMPEPVDQRTSSLSEAPAVRQLEAELREYAASAAY
jgi:tetratricopeptide (TPR) repeat protein